MAEHLSRGIEQGTDTSVREGAFFDPEFISMYELPGEKLGPQDVERYVRSTDKTLTRLSETIDTVIATSNDQELRGEVFRLLRVFPGREGSIFQEKIQTALHQELKRNGLSRLDGVILLLSTLTPESREGIYRELVGVIRRTIEQDQAITFKVARLIPLLAPQEQREFAEQGLLQEERGSTNEVLLHFGSLDQTVQVALFEKAIAVARDQEAINLALRLDIVPEQDRPRYAELLKARPVFPGVRDDLELTLALFLPPDEAVEVVARAATSYHHDMQARGIEAMRYLQVQDRRELLTKLFIQGSMQVTSQVVTTFAESFTREERAQVVTEILADTENVRGCSRLLEVISASSDAIQRELYEYLIPFFEVVVTGGTSWYRHELAALYLKHIPLEERARWLIPLLADQNRATQQEAAASIVTLPAADQDRAYDALSAHLEEQLRKKDRASWERAFVLIHFLPTTRQEQIKKRFSRRLRTRYVPVQPLYHGVRPGFTRQRFPKTGSELVVFGKVPFQDNEERTLQDKIILHRLGAANYLAWKKLFEAAPIWREEGFEYVPIEPITSVLFTRAAPFEPRVFSRVLGPNVKQWRVSPGLFLADIQKQMDRIKAVLVRMGVVHGHHHEENFCLMPMRDSKGEVDLFQPPRVYLIDFDVAKQQNGQAFI